MSKYCVNIDWFEVFTYEPVDCYGAEWYEELGYVVARRDYGTRVYAEMFTLIDKAGNPWLEVRRNPLSKKSQGGILPDRACSLRLVNRACYDWFPVVDLYNFLRDLGFQYKNRKDDARLCSITRVDLCVDFLDASFVVDGSPIDCDSYIRQYLAGDWWKIGAAKMQSFGEEMQSGMKYHAIKFGSPTSMVGTKLYNKTLEMAQVKIKPWIVESWVNAGLLKDEHDMADVWRLEFSIQAGADKWVMESTVGGSSFSMSNDIEAFCDTANYSRFLRGLCSHYFQFAYKELITDKETGQIRPQSKYRCKRFCPLSLPADVSFRPVHLKPVRQTSGRGEKILINKLHSLRDNPHVADRFKPMIDGVLLGLYTLYGGRAIGHDPDADGELLRRLCDDYGDKQISAMFEEMICDLRFSREDRAAFERTYYIYSRCFRDWVAGRWREKEPYSITAVRFAEYERLTAEEKIALKRLNKQLEFQFDHKYGREDESEQDRWIAGVMENWEKRKKE